MRILLASPVRQSPRVLERFLKSVRELQQGSFELDYAFIDDNQNPRSSHILQDFCQSIRQDLAPERNVPEIIAATAVETVTGGYMRTEHTHHWDDASIWKVAGFKDRLIEMAMERDHDALFLVDSDLVLHPETIEQLLSDDKPIVSMIFWTSWQPGTVPLPQVWLSDEYVLYERRNGRETLSDQEIGVRTEQFLSMLRRPGVYPVGGLGACTLISRDAMLNGARFERIDNLSLWGEDRHFCVRARALGIPLFVDTHYPATHLYRDSDLEPAAEPVRAPTSDPLVSRFVRVDDNRVDEVVFPLPAPWWSRPYEYAWAQEFVEPGHVVLDAACGISHPFKLWVATKAAETHAIDLDRRILSPEAILEDIGRDFGAVAERWTAAHRDETLDRILFEHGSIERTPYRDGHFDRIFCISVLEHMPGHIMLATMREFHRILTLGGMVVLTFDSPTISPQAIHGLAESSGFVFAGPFEPSFTSESLFTPMYGGLRCFRAVLRKR